MDRCWFDGCQAKPGSGANSNLDAHHIRFQSEADANGVIDGRFDKDDLFNLVCLCKQHHIEVHQGLYVIDGWTYTSSGRKLLYRAVPPVSTVTLPDSPNVSKPPTLKRGGTQSFACKQEPA
jgi:DNA mismatch repair protein MutS